jgi:hypothetical protein
MRIIDHISFLALEAVILSEKRTMDRTSTLSFERFLSPSSIMTQFEIFGIQYSGNGDAVKGKST